MTSYGQLTIHTPHDTLSAPVMGHGKMAHLPGMGHTTRLQVYLARSTIQPEGDASDSPLLCIAYVLAPRR